MLKQILTWPMGSNMKMDLSSGSHDTRADLEQANANRIRTGLRQGRVAQNGSTKVGHQQRRNRMKLETDRIGTESVATQPVRVHTEFRFFMRFSAPPH